MYSHIYEVLLSNNKYFKTGNCKILFVNNGTSNRIQKQRNLFNCKKCCFLKEDYHFYVGYYNQLQHMYVNVYISSQVLPC